MSEAAPGANPPGRRPGERATSAALRSLWLVFAALAVSGVYTADAFRVLLPVSALLLWNDRRKGGDLFERIVEALRRRTRTWTVMVIALSFFALAIAAGIFIFESLDGLPWDLGYYVQATRSMALRGVPEATFSGSAIDYNFIHHSYDKHFLAWAYRLTGSPRVVPVWHALFLMAPGLVFMAIYRALCRRKRIRAEPLGYLLAFLCWALNPTVLLQVAWSYAFNILGLSLIALAYLFYFEGRRALFLAALAAAAFEKEEFGFIGFAFCGLAIFEWLRDTSRPHRFRWAAAALAVGTLCLSSYFTFTRKYEGFASFARAYGELGANPAEAIRTLLHHPGVYFRVLTRAQSLEYLGFFALAGFLWLRPTFSAAKYLIPVLPLIVLNALNSWGMAQLNMHYSLPVMVGFCATLLLGIYAGDRPLGLLLVLVLVPPLWGHELPTRTLRKSATLWVRSAPERARIAALKAETDTVICCDDRLCTSLLDRDGVFTLQACAEGTPLLEPLLGHSARYLVRAGTRLDEGAHARSGLPRAAPPDTWAETVGSIRISEPVPIAR